LILNIEKIGKNFNVNFLFPVHPRTEKIIKKINLKKLNFIKFSKPLNFLDFLTIMKNSKIIFSGDYTQSDLTKENDKKGIQHFMRILKCLKEFTAIEFGIEDIVRSDFLKQYIIAKYNIQSNGNY
jgi:hypothetical protein